MKIVLALLCTLWAAKASADCGSCKFVGYSKFAGQDIEICDCRNGGSPPKDSGVTREKKDKPKKEKSNTTKA